MRLANAPARDAVLAWTLGPSEGEPAAEGRRELGRARHRDPCRKVVRVAQVDEPIPECVADVILGAANAQPGEVDAEPDHVQARLLMLRAGGRRMSCARGPVVDGPDALVVRVDDTHGSGHEQSGRVALRHCAQGRRRHVEQEVLELGPDHPKDSHAEVLVHRDGDLGGRLERRLEGVNGLERRRSLSVDSRLHKVLGGFLDVVEHLVV